MSGDLFYSVFVYVYMTNACVCVQLGVKYGCIWMSDENVGIGSSPSTFWNLKSLFHYCNDQGSWFIIFSRFSYFCLPSPDSVLRLRLPITMFSFA